MLISVRTDLHGTIYFQREEIKALEKRIQQNQDALNALSVQSAQVSDNLAQATVYRDTLKTASGKTRKILRSMEVLATKSEIKATQALAILSEIESAQILTALLKIKVTQALAELPETAASQSSKEWLKITTTQVLTQRPKTQATQIFAGLLETHLGQDLGKLSQENITKALKALDELSKAQAAIEVVHMRLEDYQADTIATDYNIKVFALELNDLNVQIEKAEKTICKKQDTLKRLKLSLDGAEEKLKRKQEIISILESKQPSFFAQIRLEQEKFAKTLVPPITEAILHHLDELEDYFKKKDHANSPRRR